jgi:hypothetical protein
MFCHIAVILLQPHLPSRFKPLDYTERVSCLGLVRIEKTQNGSGEAHKIFAQIIVWGKVALSAPCLFVTVIRPQPISYLEASKKGLVELQR